MSGIPVELPSSNNNASGWIQLAPNSKRDFIGCFTTSDNEIYTFTGSLKDDVQLVSNSATLGYNVASEDLTGNHQVNSASVGTAYFTFTLDNNVTLSGKLDVAATSYVATTGGGLFTDLGKVTTAPKTK
ncbi:hypothetical protein OBBRIDRAFT_836213 [Obba rivulosa]|uniref:Uncharacterized protein n=1 Tax=Obba rivulosa TaxID=1052685 RepID=A0A8E2AQV2_9APHY|nr:hypothetical protein OBBRIDRAFT_836213 [Obba rivulosa]